MKPSQRGCHRGPATVASVRAESLHAPRLATIPAEVSHLKVSGRKSWGNFVGQWAPTLLILGLYNKVVKQHGH